ncbi:MAG: signal peptidase I [Candidatus Shapirobacteria bacterium]|nr:signal peptidase I [Candidatus Shapirobacteria bacterium]
MKKAFYWLSLSVLFLLTGVIVISAFNLSDDWRLLIVQSGSMEPAIRTGSLVIVRKINNYQKGEVITYWSKKDSKTTVTHRIVEIKDGQFITKGDANDVIDAISVDKELILGKINLVIPLLGYPISFAKTLPGLIILIVIPSTIIVYSEILSIKNEILRFLIRKKKDD